MGDETKMKYVGTVRKVDELGRIVLPIEIRRALNIEIRDAVEISADDSTITLRKYTQGDIFTGSTDNLINYHGKNISVDSIKEMAKLAGLVIKG